MLEHITTDQLLLVGIGIIAICLIVLVIMTLVKGRATPQADPEMALQIALNAKVQRPGVCRNR